MPEIPLHIHGPQSEGHHPDANVVTTEGRAGSDRSPGDSAGGRMTGVDAAPAQPRDSRPQILSSGDGRLTSEVADDHGQVLSKSGFYLWKGDVHHYDDKRRAFELVTPTNYRTLIEDHLIPRKVKRGMEITHTLSSNEAGTILRSTHFRRHLSQIELINRVRQPVMRADGSLGLLPEGHDAESKVFTLPGATYPLDMALSEAKAFVDKLLKDFPWANEMRARATAVAAGATLFGINLLPRGSVLPIFVYPSNAPGSGKGLLVQTAVLPVLGYTPTGVMPRSGTEMRKLLHAAAIEAQPVVIFDNVTGHVASGPLEAYSTATTVTGRVLGTSETRNGRKCTVIFLTGNHLTFSADMARRSLAVELYLHDDGAERGIETPLDEYVLLGMRPQFLAAQYAFVREWAKAGKPGPAKLNPNFTAWSKIIGGIIEHAGFGPVTDSPETLVRVDADEADLLTLTQALFEEHQTRALTFMEVVALARTRQLFGRVLQPDAPLTRATNTALGRLFAAQDQRTFSNKLRFVVIGTGHAKRYAVRQEVGDREGGRMIS